jgi:hypothetical protein
MISDAGFQYWDFTSDKRIVYNSKFFADPLHLNQTGAEYFNSLLAAKLIEKKLLSSKRLL